MIVSLLSHLPCLRHRLNDHIQKFIVDDGHPADSACFTSKAKQHGTETVIDRAEETRFLRNGAHRLRDLARNWRLATALKLMEFAAELDRRADELEAGG